MKFDIRNRYTNEVQFTAEIDCADDAGDAVKKGLAVLWAIKSGAYLIGANLDGASLDGASLVRARLINASLINASLDGASMINASLDRASLDGASLDGAKIDGASLIGASLINASLINASLDGASMINASLDRASLDGASLDGASLDGASLDGASLDGASINSVSGLNDWIKCMQLDTYAIAYTADVIQIGCQRHTHAEWAAFSDAQIRAMDGVNALNWWRKWKEPLFQLIALAPAKPTGFVQETAE